MDKHPVPTWMKHLWDELTKPPAILSNQQPRSRAKGTIDSNPQRDDEADYDDDVPARAQRRTGTGRTSGGFALRDLFDSPTDPPLEPRSPKASARTATRVAQKYFVPKRTQRRPATKPRPRNRALNKPPGAPALQPRTNVTAQDGRAKSSRPVSPSRITSPSMMRSATAPMQSMSALPLSVQAATQQVREALDCRIVDAQIVDSVWRVTTDRAQVYALKETSLPLARLRFMADALDEVYRLGFTHVARIIRRRSGDPYLQDAGHIYILSEWLSGNRAQFGSTRQVGAAARATARLHDVSRRFTPKAEEPPCAFAVFDHLIARKQDLLHIQNQLEQGAEPDEFDLLALRQLAKANQQATDALALLKLPETERDLLLAVQDPGLCHLDITRRNVIMHPNGFAQLIDFDRMAFGPRTLDLAHLIRRAMQAHGTWTSEVAIAPLLAYNRVRPLTQGEYLLLEALLVFPHRLWRQLRTHYDDTTESEAQARKSLELLRDTLALEEERERFLVTFARQVTRRERS